MSWPDYMAVWGRPHPREVATPSGKQDGCLGCQRKVYVCTQGHCLEGDDHRHALQWREYVSAWNKRATRLQAESRREREASREALRGALSLVGQNQHGLLSLDASRPARYT